MDFDDSFDDDYEAWDDDYGDAESDDAEFYLGDAAPAQQSSSRRRGPVNRAKPRGNITSGVQGRQFGVVRTPQGNARVELPGKFPTLDEFKQSVAKLQQDISANSSGIAQLNERLKQDASLEAGARTKGTRALRRNLKRTQWAALVAIAVPLVMEAMRPQEARVGAEP